MFTIFHSTIFFFQFRNIISSKLTRDRSQAITAPLNTLI